MSHQVWLWATQAAVGHSVQLVWLWATQCTHIYSWSGCGPLSAAGLAVGHSVHTIMQLVWLWSDTRLYHVTSGLAVGHSVQLVWLWATQAAASVSRKIVSLARPLLLSSTSFSGPFCSQPDGVRDLYYDHLGELGALASSALPG